MAPIVEILICAIFWGFAGPIIRWSQLPIISILTIRFAVPLFVSYLYIRFVEKKSVQRIGKALGYASILAVLGNLFFISAFSFTSISNVLLLLYTRPVVATLFGALMLGEHVSWKLWALLAASFTGAALIICSHDLSLSNRDIIGMALSLASSTSIACMWGIIKKYGYGNRSTHEVIFYQHLIGGVIALFILPFVIATGPVPGMSLAFLYGFVVGYVSSLLYFNGLRSMALSHAMPITYAELIIAVVSGVYFFGEILDMQTMVGGILIVTSALATIGFIKQSSGKKSSTLNSIPPDPCHL